MSKKRTSLDAILSRTVNTAPAEPPAAPPSEPEPPRRRERVKGTVAHSTYLPIPVHEQLRRLAFDERRKMHDYLLDGLDLVFRQKGLPTIAELKGRGEG